MRHELFSYLDERLREITALFWMGVVAALTACTLLVVFSPTWPAAEPVYFLATVSITVSTLSAIALAIHAYLARRI